MSRFGVASTVWDTSMRLIKPFEPKEPLFDLDPQRIPNTPRKTRIEGVADGQFDMATVNEPVTTIQRIAGMELYVETMFEDELILIANPPARSKWKQQWLDITKATQVRAKDLLGLPFILPEADSSRRKQLDDWVGRASSQQLDIVLETGGWQNILAYAADGVGVAIVPQSSLHSTTLSLITRKSRGQHEPEISQVAMEFLSVVRETCETG